MLPRNHRMELLSKAYVHAVASYAGCGCDDVRSDFGIDLSIRAVSWSHGRFIDDGLLLDLQLKSTLAVSIRGTEDRIFYELAVRNYDHLREQIRDWPRRLLVLFLMPENEDEWLTQDRQGMVMRQCCYYLSLKGYPVTSNKKTVTVEIPQANLFSADYLHQLLEARKNP